ncbi:GNAT family N-acetyltransferase [Viridibacillus sp. YIM B01967]|uniref:GNAT family N-acetyltransferase n=1 Tax=Viridibacillus soli TaxID=2798301 RepID=A0ABS1H800_9BACL|nr:GNAT family N-acetyltransferase [Viridibacillus soli]MBK3495548.1 GNAT family N-acetyltransferase [Viridibacillus soli]
MNSIYKGQLSETPFDISLLSNEHLPALQQLQTIVYNALPDQTVLQPLTQEEFENILGGNGLMIGAFVANELIAFRALLEPDIDDEHLGRDCGVAESELSRVLYQEISNVSPNYRGFGLQKTLARVIMEQVDVGRFDYICATVKPFNIPSLKDKFSQGMMVAALKLKYEGKLRYVFFKKTAEENLPFSEACHVLMSDTAEQQRLLKEGWLGVQLFMVNDDWLVEYKRT